MKITTTLCSAFLLLAGLPTVGGVLHAQEEGAYPRIALIEEFTSVTCGPCAQITPVINAALKDAAGRAVSIRYHVNLPLPGDPWYKANQSQSDNRQSYYSLANPPQFHVDGRVLSSKDDIKPETSVQAAATAPIKIEVTQTPTGDNQVDVSVKVTADGQGLDGDDYWLRIAVVESHIEDHSVSGIPGYNGESEFEDVFRALVPSAQGQSIKLNPNQSKTFTASYTVGDGWQPDQLYVVAFVQNDFTSDLYSIVQAGYSSKTSGVESEALAGYRFDRIAPNPARNNAVVDYALGSAGKVVVELHDMNGGLAASIDQGVQEAGDHRLNLDLGSVPSGTYTCTVRSGEFVESRRLVVVK